MPYLAGGVFYRGTSRGYRIIEQSPESFTEQHALLAKETIAKYWATGHRPLQVLQGLSCIAIIPRNPIINYYYFGIS
jgi:hypothetical protein